MQHGYGSEFQQFMVDASSLFSISSSAAAPPPLSATSPSVPPTSLHHPHFTHFHSPIPFTQQLFQQHTQTHHPHHHFQLFNHSQQEQHERARLLVHQQLGLDPESGPENSGGTGGGTAPSQSFLSAAMGFKLAVDGGGTGGGDEDDVMLTSGGNGGGEEESAIKEPSWRPLDIDYISSNNNKRCKDKDQDTSPPSPPPAKYFKKSPEASNPNNNYKLFSELEAIYKPGSSTNFPDCAAPINQTGSGSALTGDETPPVLAEPMGVGHLSCPTATETSAGEEATPAKRGLKRKRRRQRRLSSLASFFERLVRQLVDHQEALHNRFLESMERREQERASREEAWRLQEAAKAAREAAVRAQERTLATAREAAIVSFLEKITGETISLPSSADTSAAADVANANCNELQLANVDVSNQELTGSGNISSLGHFNSGRWPKSEVQALIRVRSGLESRFQEPGLKGPLWEEVSMRMAGLGFRRNAKRCKEKWENINKYFRKAKESGKKRPQHSKTCPYFHQLDQLYSKSNCMIYSPNSPSRDADVAKGGGSELLDAVVVPLDQNNMNCSKFEDQNCSKFEGKESDEEEEEEDEEEREEEEEREGEGESHNNHGQDLVQNRRNDSSLFF